MPRSGFALAGGAAVVTVMVRYDVRRLVPVRPTRGECRKWNSVCQSRVVVVLLLLLLEAVAVREGFGLAMTIGKYGRVVRNGLLARACVLACCALCHQSRIVLPPNNITLPCKIPRQTPGGTRLGSSKQACVLIF